MASAERVREEKKNRGRGKKRIEREEKKRQTEEVHSNLV